VAGGDRHPGVPVGSGAAGVEHANGNGRPPVASDALTRGETAAELERAVTRLELANEALQRENARLARGIGGQAGSAAAVRLTGAERRWSERAEVAELEVERLAKLLATPRHRAVERARERLMRSRFLYPPVRRLSALATKILRLQQ
jgi:hypothetical protein